MRVFAFFLLSLGLVAFLGSFAVANRYESHAERFQLVKPSEGAALFGDAGEPIGKPMEYVIFDRSVVMADKTPEGLAQLDDTKMKQKGIYPLQLQTVRYVIGLTRWGSVAVAALGGILLLWARRRLRPSA
ncbi:MAG: hypothetical protein ABL962_04925 [Fimbriimonadaceae bacterium]